MNSSHIIFDPSWQGSMVFLGDGGNVFRGGRSVMNMEETSKRRPFFSSPDELFDEEQLPEKKRRLTHEQVHMLEKSFEEDNKLEPERKTQLAKKLGLQRRQVAVWFQNRRARWKTKQLERDYDQLKCSYDSLASEYDSILKENQKLKSEVVSLTEKLQAKEDPLPVDAAHVPAMQFTLKVEDRLSTGSGESAVVDENGPQLVDSCDSYLPGEYYPGCVAPPLKGIQSEDDDGSDDGRSYFSDAFVATEQQHREEEETLGWWVWS